MNFEDLAPAAAALLPTVVAALLALLVGLVVASLLRRGAVWFVKRASLDALAERAGSARLLYAVGIRRNVPDLVGLVVYTGGLLLTAAVVAEIVGLPSVAVGIGAVLKFLPRVFASVLILLGGVLAADMLRGLVSAMAARRGDVESPDLVGTLVYYAVVVVALSMATGHLGIDTDLINGIIEVGFAGAIFSVGLMFALAGRDTARNVISRHYANRMFRKGDLVAVDGVSGEVVDFGPQSVWLRTAEGMVVVPCARLTDSVVKTQLAELGDPVGAPPVP